MCGTQFDLYEKKEKEKKQRNGWKVKGQGKKGRTKGRRNRDIRKKYSSVTCRI